MMTEQDTFDALVYKANVRDFTGCLKESGFEEDVFEETGVISNGHGPFREFKMKVIDLDLYIEYIKKYYGCKVEEYDDIIIIYTTPRAVLTTMFNTLF